MGAWKGWGGFIQFQWKDPFYIDNANFLKAPEYELVNLNFYYNVDLVASTYFKSAIIYFFGGSQRVQLNLPGFRQQQFRQPQSGDRAENPGSVLAVTGTGSNSMPASRDPSWETQGSPSADCGGQRHNEIPACNMTYGKMTMPKRPTRHRGQEQQSPSNPPLFPCKIIE